MKPLRLLIVFALTLGCLLATSAAPAFADARGDCPGADADGTTADLSAVRSSVICLTNRERTARGMGALKEQSTLASVAQSHSDDMAQNNYLAHADLKGGMPWDRATSAGYSNGTVGENIAGGYASPFDVTLGWMQSSAHCANILDPQFEEVGIGVATNTGSSYGIYWTMMLGGKSSATPTVTITCPYTALSPVATPPAGGSGSPASPLKAKITSFKRRRDGRYHVEGRVTPAAKGTAVTVTITRGKRFVRYIGRTTKSGLFAMTVRAPAGSRKVRASAKA
jgi:uncharacterized protein YkwD